MREHRNLGWVFVGFILLAMASCVPGVAGCGSSSAPSSSSAAPSPAPPNLNSTWATVGQLDDELVSLVVLSSTGFNEAERKYLVRSNVAWHNIRQVCVDCATAQGGTSDPTGTQAISRTVASTTSLWLRMKAPSERFATFHKQSQALMSRLSAMSQLTEKQALAATQEEKDDLAARLAKSGASLSLLADGVAAKGEALRDRFGHDPSPSSATGGLTAAEAAQIMAIVQGSVWITGPLKEANTLLNVPMPSWSPSTVATFCLDMGFVQAECDNWINTPAAGPTIAYAYGEYVAGLRILRRGADELITAAENLDADAAAAGAASIEEASPHVSRAVAAFRSLLPSAFSN